MSVSFFPTEAGFFYGMFYRCGSKRLRVSLLGAALSIKFIQNLPDAAMAASMWWRRLACSAHTHTPALSGLFTRVADRLLRARERTRR